MKTWIEIFEYGEMCNVEGCVNTYCRNKGVEPISASMSFNDGKVFLAVVLKESEDTE